MKFILSFVFIWIQVFPAEGSTSGVDVCEFEDVILLFPNTPDSAVSGVKAKTWNKENNIRLATWTAGGKFVPLPSYEDRLILVGSNSIKIRNATRYDTGTYTLILTSGSIQVLIEHTSHLKVIVPPNNICIPNVTREGDVLMAVLSSNDCGVPSLTPEWRGTNQTFRGNISILSLEPGPVKQIYTACAVGKSLDCFVGDPTTLCYNYSTAVQSPQILPTSIVSEAGIIGVIIFYVLIGAIFLVYWKVESVKKRLCPRHDTRKTVDIQDEESHLMKTETAVEDIADGSRTVAGTEILEHKTPPIIDVKVIKKHLIDQYKTMKAVSLAPCYEENYIDVSRVYCELEIKHLGVQDEECRLNRVAENVASEQEIFSSHDTDHITPIPALLLGECGSGKTTWCKNIVDQWCQYYERNESNVEMTDSSIPYIAKFEILLYIPFKKDLEGLSFNDYLKTTVFANVPDYYDYTTRYISEHRETVLVLIDGFDEVICNPWSIVTLLMEKTTIPCLIVLTSRPIGLKHLQKVGISLRLFQIQAMIPDKSKEYVSKVLDVLCDRRGETLNINHFWKFAKHMQVQSMCNTPLLCLSLILSWINSQTDGGDLTEVILTVVEGCIRHAIARMGDRPNISNDMGELNFTENKRIIRCLTEHSYLLNVVCFAAEKLWCTKLQDCADVDIIFAETDPKYNEIELCFETGILIKPIKEVFGTKGAQITFSHPLLFDFFVALSIAKGNRELFTRYITTKDDVIKHCYMIHMLCQIAPSIGQDLMKNVSKIYDKDNDKRASEKMEVLEQKLICKIKCKKDNRLKWLQRLIRLDELSNAKLSILSDGMAFDKDLTHFRLELPENRNELIFRLPILPKLQVLRIDIRNCTLMLQEEQKWKKVELFNINELVIKSVHVDVTTTGCIIKAISSCNDLVTLEFCPKDDSNEVVAAQSNLKLMYSWGLLAKAIPNMTKLKIFRLHNLEVGEHLPVLLDILCRSPKMEILDLKHLKETGTGEMLIPDDSVQGFSTCTHHETTFTKGTQKRLQLTKNEMSETSWLALSERLETLSPHILHIEQVHQSYMVLEKLLQGIGKCTDLNILSICNIRARNESVSFTALRNLHKLTTLTLCKLDIPDLSWNQLFYTLARLTSLKEMSLSRLKKPNCFIEVQNISKLKCITLTEIHLEEALWSKFGNEISTLPKLIRLELVSCIMSHEGLLTFQQKMNEAGFIVENAKTSETEDIQMLSVDITLNSKKKKKSKDAKK
ncbi:hypothetical protein ACJMK2_035838 [Sinanodonta woodiana]|uniref:NACHT domain-containing protein n=1 Tax=Sinanodonta woodiana TaxID=1069815 RepID=A0ABD3WIS3_SINWO